MSAKNVVRLGLGMHRDEAIYLPFPAIALNMWPLCVVICALKKRVERLWDLRVDHGRLAPKTKAKVVPSWNHSLVK